MYSNYCSLLARDTIKHREWSRCYGDVGTQIRVCLASVIWDNDKLSRFQHPESFSWRTPTPPSYLYVYLHPTGLPLFPVLPSWSYSFRLFIWHLAVFTASESSSVQGSINISGSDFLDSQTHSCISTSRKGRNCTCLGSTHNSSVQDDTLPHCRYVGNI